MRLILRRACRSSDLLTQIAKDRLVVMVTRNLPFELAQQYATRIVNLTHGVITSDT